MRSAEINALFTDCLWGALKNVTIVSIPVDQFVKFILPQLILEQPHFATNTH